MTALAAELDRKLAELGAPRASLLERLMREAMALAEASPAHPPAGRSSAEGGAAEMTELQRVPLSTADYEHLCAALERPPRDRPRLRRLMEEGQ